MCYYVRGVVGLGIYIFSRTRDCRHIKFLKGISCSGTGPNVYNLRQVWAVKPAGQGICIASNFLLTFILSQAFLSILCKMKYGVFLFYAGWVLIMTIFVGLFLPETKGLPFQEMDKIWQDHWFWYQFVEDPSSNYANMIKFNKLLQNFLCDSTAGTRGVSYYFHFDTAGVIISQDIRFDLNLGSETEHHFDLWEVKQNSSVWSMIWLLLYQGIGLDRS